MHVPPSNPRRTLQRYEGLGSARFLTFSCYRRLPLFNNDAIKDCFVAELTKYHAQRTIQLYAWVIMPEHVHLLLRPVDEQQGLNTLLRSFKPGFGKLVLNRWRELKAPILDRLEDRHGQTHFWQTGGGYDRNIISQEEFLEKLEYIHANPVKRGLCGSPVDWAWSSALWYLDRGLYVGPGLDAWG